MLARAISFAATIGVLGAVWFRLAVLPRAVAGVVDESVAAGLARRVALVSSIALAVTVPWRVLMQARALTLEGDPWAPMVPRVISTSWGHAMTWQLAAALIAAGALAMAKPAAAWGRTAVAAAVMAVVPALSGHAAASEHLVPLAVAADALHVAAAGGWAGALGILTAFAIRERHADGSGPRVAALIDAFHLLAMWSVAALAATGLFGAWLHLRAPGDLVSTNYGGVLVAKLALVAVAGLLGWRHSRMAAKRAHDAGASAVAASLATEWSFMLVVIALTAVLAGSPPPGME